MPINQAAFSRLQTGTFTAESVSRILGSLAGVLDLTGAATSQIQLDYQHASDTIEPGDLIPFIAIGLRPATEVARDDS